MCLYLISVLMVLTSFSSAFAIVSNCEDIAGTWEGIYEGLDCDNDVASGPWEMTVESNCDAVIHAPGIEEEVFVAGAFTGNVFYGSYLDPIDPDDCGTTYAQGAITGNSIAGTFWYEQGGSGTFAGEKKVEAIPSLTHGAPWDLEGYWSLSAWPASGGGPERRPANLPIRKSGFHGWRCQLPAGKCNMLSQDCVRDLESPMQAIHARIILQAA